MFRIFISSVQREFSAERKSLAEYIRCDAILGRFFEVFIFEEAPSKFEIPERAVKEAIVNAVCHRDYTSCASVQVMLFKDRLEVWSPGPLPKGMTLAKFYRRHKSYPANPFLAYAMFLVKYIEETGTGSRDVVALCEEAGLPKPRWFVEDGDDFRIVIKRPEVDNVPVNVPADELIGEAINEVIFEAIRQTPGVNKPKIIKLVGKSRATVERAIAGLIAEDRVEHRGSKKTGGYYVREENSHAS